MWGQYTDCALLTKQGQYNGTLLQGSWAELLQWPAARRVESTDYPERDGKVVDFGAGLYDGAPRELRLPLYINGNSAEALQHMLRYEMMSQKIELFVDSLGYRARMQVNGVEAIVQGQHAAWASVRMLECELPEWFVHDWSSPAAGHMFGTLELRGGGDFDKFGVGVALGAWAPKGEAPRKRLSNPGYALADGVGREEAKVVLPCAMGGFKSVGDLLCNYGAAWRWLVSRTAEAELRTARAVYHGARYESQRVVAFNPVRRWMQFEVTLAVRRVEVL